jgi:hypothetical protein
MIGTGFGLMFLTALGLFFTNIIKGLRVYTASEAAFWSNFPVIGSSAWPNDPNALHLLIRDLDDYAPKSLGYTLVVPISDDEEERHYAQELARSLYQSNICNREVLGNAEPRRDSEESSSNPLFPDAILGVSNSQKEQTETDKPFSTIDAWMGSLSDPNLRRAARLADRILITVRSGEVSIFQLTRLSSVLGRFNGIGLVILDQDKTLSDSADRAGPVAAFWNFEQGSDK